MTEPFSLAGSCSGSDYVLTITANAPVAAENITITDLAGDVVGVLSDDGTTSPDVTYAGTNTATSYTVLLTASIDVDGLIDADVVGGAQANLVALANPRVFDRNPATFWSWQGEYMTTVMIDGNPYFAVFDYDGEEKIAAWSFWNVAGVTNPVHPSFVPKDDRMYFLDGDGMYYFDAAASDFVDTTDDPADPYESRLEFHFYDMNRPGSWKKYMGMDIEQQGEAYIAFLPVPHDRSVLSEQIRYTGLSNSRRDIPMALRSHGLAPILWSKDRTGWTLEALALHFDYLR